MGIKIATMTLVSVFFLGMMINNAVFADEIKFLCYQQLNECKIIQEIAKKFEAKTGHRLKTEIVGYEIIRDQLENQLQTKSAPDLARVTNLGGLTNYFLDLTPYVDVNYWNKNYSATLPWMRKPNGIDKGIYGWLVELTVTGPYVNVTMFEDAGVELPGQGATWDDWATALTEVKKELGLTAGLAMDRTAHRWAGPAFSYGAKFFDKNNKPILVDQGFRKFAKIFVRWHKDGLMPVEGWPAGKGTKYRNASPMFLNGTVAMHMSGSWMINSYAKNIKDFVWKAVPAPCGTGGCGAMPGGAALVAFKSSKSPKAAAAFVNFMAQTKNAATYAAATRGIPAHQGLQKSGIDYKNVPPFVAEALSTFALNASKAAETTPQAYTFQGYSKNFVIYGTVPNYLTKAITGEMSLENALKAIDADVAAKIAE